DAVHDTAPALIPATAAWALPEHQRLADGGGPRRFPFVQDQAAVQINLEARGGAVEDNAHVMPGVDGQVRRRRAMLVEIAAARRRADAAADLVARRLQPVRTSARTALVDDCLISAER